MSPVAQSLHNRVKFLVICGVSLSGFVLVEIGNEVVLLAQHHLSLALMLHMLLQIPLKNLGDITGASVINFFTSLKALVAAGVC